MGANPNAIQSPTEMNYKDWVIESHPSLDGGGTFLAPIFARVLKGKHFNTAFEWCAGPAWIGLWLLENGIYDELVTGDINGESVKMVRKTASNHNYRVRAYSSDNLNSIPDSEMFDLVVSNPPNYSNIQRTHPFGYMRDDLRPSDINWKIHNNFYDNIRPHLNNNFALYISEVEPYKTEVYLDGFLYDLRDQIPMQDFIEMTGRNGMKIKREIPYTVGPVECSILEIVDD